ncbi:hypothetical protein [Vibrio phage 2 TSL-2019]|uniref:Big-1 domain-containing protein n=1 Tax=Vibrio phage 2 TSL-2019 TaxID=2508172 RepID=A0A513PW64_9CAUD|nr:hypothetical protein HWC03_gp028 [Vibrio phage 2 TSL-2019]QAU04183.1 hypothetical protein [Vibrio phage 2 TSL-2019]
MAGVIRGNLLNGDVAVNPEGPVNLTLKRDDGLPDTEVVTDAQGNWEVTVESASKKKVLFTFFDKSKPLGTHEVDFVKELEIMPASGKFNTEYMNGFHLRLVDANMDPIVGVDVTYEYKYDDVTEWVSSTVTTEEGGYAGTMWSANGTDPQKLHIRVSYGDLNDEFVYDFTTQSLSTFFGDTLAPKELAVGEELQLVGRVFPKYGSGAVNFETDAYLGYFSDNALYTKDLSDHLEWGGKFKAKVPEQKVTLLTNNGYTEIAPPIVTDLKAPALFRLSVRSIMINNPDLHYSGSWEMTGRIYTKDYETPNVTTDYLVLHDYNNSPYSDDVYMNSDWAFESWVGSRDGSKSCTATCRGRLLGDDITRYSTLGDMLNLIVGTKNFVHVGREAVNRVGLVDDLGNPKVGVTVKFFKGDETTAFGEAVTDNLGVAEITIPAEAEVSRQYWRAEVGELVLGYYNDWVPETVPLAETVNTPFIPAFIEPDRALTFKLNGIDKNGTPLPLNDNMMYEGIVVQCLENWYLRSYVSSASDGTYDYRLALSDSTSENVKLTIGLACDHFHTEKEVVVGKVEGLNPLPYAQGTSVAGRSLVSGWRLLDAELNPVVGSIVQVWLDDKTGNADFNLTTDKYGIVHFTAPYEEGNLVRKAYAQSGDQEHVLELMWTEKQAGCDITVGIPDFVATEEQTTFNVRTLDQMGNEVNEESPQLYALGRYGLNVMAYRKSTGEIIPLGMDRTGELNITTGVEEGEQDYVIYTEAGFKEFTVNAVKRPTRNVERVPYSSSNAFPESDALVAFNVVDENNLGVPGETVEIRYLGLEVDKLIGNSWVRVYEGGSDEVIATLVTDEFGIVEYPVTTPAGTGTHGWGATRVNPGPKDAVGEAKIYVHWRDAIVTSLRDFKSIPVTESGEYSAYSTEVWENVSETEEEISDSNRYLEIYVKELNRTLYTMSDFYKGRSVGVIEEALPDGTYNAVIYTQNARHEFTITWGAVTPVVPTELNYDSFQAKKYPAGALLYSSVSLNDANGPITQITKSHKVVVYNSGGQSVGSGFVDIDGTANIRWETSWGVPKPTETYEFRIGSDVLFSMTADLVVNPQVSVAPYTLSNPVIGYPVLTGALVENEAKDGIVSGIYVTLEDGHGNVYAEGETDEFGFFDAMYERVGTESHLFVRPRCGQSTTYHTGPWVDTSVSRYIDLRFIDPPATVDSDASVFMNGMMYDQNGTPANSVSYYVYDVRNRQRVGGTSKSDGRIEPWLSDIQLGKNPIIVYSANGLAKHVVEYKKMPASAEIVSGYSETLAFDGSPEVTYQLKEADGSNYTPNDGEVVHVLAQSGRYQHRDNLIGPTGLVTVPWFSKGVGPESYVLASEDMSKAINTTSSEHVAVKSVDVFHVNDWVKSGDSAIMLVTAQDFNDSPIPNIEFRVESVTEGFEFNEVYKTDANGVGKVVIPGQPVDTYLKFQVSCGNAVSSNQSVDWSDDGRANLGTVVLDTLTNEATEDEGYPVTGKVVDGEGNGIPGVTVYVYYQTPNSPYYQEDYVDTGPDGTFSVSPWLYPGLVKLIAVNGTGFDSAEVMCKTTPLLSMSNLTIQKIHEYQSGRMSAFYTDMYGRPVEGATVEFRFDSADGELIDSAVTNEKGHAWAEVTWEQARGHNSLYCVTTDASDSSPIYPAESGDTTPVVSTFAWHNYPSFLHPEMEAVFMGKVLDQHGNPIAGEMVTYYRPNTGFRTQTFTDSFGNFKVGSGPERFDPNRKDLFGFRGKFTEIAPKWNMGTKFKAGDIKFNQPNFTEGIPYDSTITLSGTVKDTYGEMIVVGDEVVKLKARVHSEGVEIGVKEFTVSPDGTWTVDIPTPNKEVKFDVWLEDEFSNGCDHVALWAGPPKFKTLAFAPPTHDYIPEGQNHTRVLYYLLDEEGNPMPNVSINFEYKGDADTRWNYGSLDRTDADGHVDVRIQLRNSTTIELRIRAEGLTTQHTIVRTSDPVGAKLTDVYYPSSTSVDRGINGLVKLTDFNGQPIADVSNVKIGIYDLVTRETYDLKPGMLDNTNFIYNLNPPAGRHRFMQYTDAYMDYYQIAKVVEVTESDPFELIVPTQIVLSPTMSNGGLAVTSDMNVKTGLRVVDDQYRDWNATGMTTIYDATNKELLGTRTEGEVHQVEISRPLDPGLHTWRVFANYKELGTVSTFIVEGDDVLNLVPGSTVVNRVDQTAVAMFGCYSAANMTPTVGKTLNVWEVGKEGVKQTLVTDDKGLAAFDLPAQTTPGVYHYIVEYDGNQVPFDFHWVAADMVLGESFGETFFPTVWTEEEYQAFKAEVIDQNGDVVSNGVEGISVKDFDDPQMNYWYNIDGEYVRPAYFTKGKHLIGMSAGAVGETFNIFSGNATGLRTLAYAQGKGLDGQNLKVAFGLTDDAFTPINGAVVKVWLGEKSGTSHYEVTTGTYGIAEFDIPQPEGVNRTWLYAESNGHELKIPVVWAKKPTPSKFSVLTVPTTLPAGSTLEFSATFVNQDDTPDTMDSWKAPHGGVYVKANQKFVYLFSASGDHYLNIIGDLSPGTHEIVFFTLTGYEVKQITIT